MLKTPLCDLLGIDVPVICAPFGPWHEVDLAAQARDALRASNTATARR
jgi:enoyl-[acyl-carrier protein] reductase II